VRVLIPMFVCDVPERHFFPSQRLLYSLFRVVSPDDHTFEVFYLCFSFFTFFLGCRIGKAGCERAPFGVSLFPFSTVKKSSMAAAIFMINFYIFCCCFHAKL